MLNRFLYAAIIFICSALMLPQEAAGDEEDAQKADHEWEEAGLSDYVRLAMENSPALEAARRQAEAADHRHPQVTAWPEPGLSYGYMGRLPDGDGWETAAHSFSLSQTIPWPGRLQSMGDEADAAAQVARRQYEELSEEVALRVREAYLEVAYLMGARSALQGIVEVLVVIEENARARMTVGNGAYVDVVAAEMESARVMDRLVSVEQVIPAAQARMNGLLGRPPQAPLGREWPYPEEGEEEERGRPDTPPEGSGHVPSEDDVHWEELLRKHSPVLKRSAAQVESRRASMDVADQAGRPDLFAGLEYRAVSPMMPSPPTAGEGGNWRNEVGAMVGVRLPIKRSSYRAAKEEARQRLGAQQAEHLDTGNQLAADLQMVLFRRRDARRKVSLYQEQLVPRAQEALESTSEAYRMGTAPFSLLLEAQRTLLELAVARERAMADQALATAELHWLTGLSEDGLVQGKAKRNKP